MKKTRKFQLKQGKLCLTFLDHANKTRKEFTTVMKNVTVATEQLVDESGDEISAPQIILAGVDEKDGTQILLQFSSWYADSAKVKKSRAKKQSVE